MKKFLSCFLLPVATTLAFGPKPPSPPPPPLPPSGANLVLYEDDTCTSSPLLTLSGNILPVNSQCPNAWKIFRNGSEQPFPCLFKTLHTDPSQVRNNNVAATGTTALCGGFNYSLTGTWSTQPWKIPDSVLLNLAVENAHHGQGCSSNAGRASSMCTTASSVTLESQQVEIGHCTSLTNLGSLYVLDDSNAQPIVVRTAMLINTSHKSALKPGKVTPKTSVPRALENEQKTNTKTNYTGIQFYTDGICLQKSLILNSTSFAQLNSVFGLEANMNLIAYGNYSLRIAHGSSYWVDFSSDNEGVDVQLGVGSDVDGAAPLSLFTINRLNHSSCYSMKGETAMLYAMLNLDVQEFHSFALI
eukprot:m.58578 g.58578  ORF g.58578 m.58578 type:complete len:358 (-) comp11185_c0_seq1:66-1139(-)